MIIRQNYTMRLLVWLHLKSSRMRGKRRFVQATIYQGFDKNLRSDTSLFVPSYRQYVRHDQSILWLYHMPQYETRNTQFDNHLPE